MLHYSNNTTGYARTRIARFQALVVTAQAQIVLIKVKHNSATDNSVWSVQF